VFRRKRLTADRQAALDHLRTVVGEIEAAKDAMTSTVPTTRLPGTPLPDALLELEEHLGRAKQRMPAWGHPDVEAEWRACDEGIDESLRRATKLREEAPDLGGFEGLIWAVDQVLAPLEAFEAAAERFRTLRR
jgi:DNA-binding transcriptional LysR family regulator